MRRGEQRAGLDGSPNVGVSRLILICLGTQELPVIGGRLRDADQPVCSTRGAHAVRESNFLNTRPQTFIHFHCIEERLFGIRMELRDLAFGNIAHAHAANIPAQLPPVILGRHARTESIPGIVASQRVQQDGGVFHRFSHRTQMVERPTDRHHAVAADDAEGRFQAHAAVGAGWIANGAGGVPAGGAQDQATAQRRAGAAA